MASPQRRPRDKGGTEFKNLAAKGFESSNSTMTKFLGGTQKSWMTGHHVVREKASSSSDNSARSGPSKQNESNQREGNFVTTQSEVSRHQSQADHQSHAIHDPEPATALSTVVDATTIDTPSALTNQNQQSVDTVLPSPAPSDEHRQESVHIIDLEQEKDQLQNHNEPNVNPPDSIEVNPLHIETLRSATMKRNIEPQGESRKRAQSISRSTSDYTRQDSLPSLNNVEERPLSSPSTQVPSSIVIGTFLHQITNRFNLVNAIRDRKGKQIEIPRLGLLQDACNSRDYFYLIIHQLFCMNSTLISNQSSFNGLTSEHLGGLTLLNHLLLPNDQMENQAVSWFSTFPLPLEVLLENAPGLKLSHKKALECLHKLPQNWMPVREHCHHRCYPPLVDEMNNTLGVASLVLQRVISRAILRDIWPGLHDECYSEGERLFRRNQQAVQLRESQERAGQILNTEYIKAYNTQIATEYQQLWARYQHHTRLPGRQSNGPQQRQGTTPNLSTPMAPPQQMQTNILPTTNVSVSQNISPSVYGVFNPSVALHANINTQSNPQSPVSFVNTPTLPSSSFTTTRNSAGMSDFQLAAPPPQRRQRGRPRRDQAPAMTSNTKESGGLIPGQNSAGISYRQGIPQPRSAPSNAPPQSLPWSDQPAMGIINAHVRQPTQSLTGIPATSPYLTNVRANAGHQSMSQQRSATFPLQRQGQIQSPSISHNPQSSNRSYNLQPGVYQLPSQYNTSRQAQSSPSHLFLQPLGQTRSPTEPPPDPLKATLHQVQARSPTFASMDVSGNIDNTVKLYAFIKRFRTMPCRLSVETRYFKWTFETSKEDYNILIKDIGANNGAPPRRMVWNGSCFYRIRCVKVTNGDKTIEDDWVVIETTWPNGVAIMINDVALEIRKKIYHGKDLPVDVTKYIKEGENILSVATIRPKEANQSTYALVLETIQIADATTIKNAISKLELHDALSRILEQSSSIDPDVQVINTAIILDLTDPYTLHIFDKPVRGQSCRHNQCFDLEVFLQANYRKDLSHLSALNNFKCPICGADARPERLIMDLFFVSVRKDLELINRLDVKAIVLDELGSWTIKEEEQIGESEADSKKLPPRVDELAHARHGKIPERRESEIIELVDD